MPLDAHSTFSSLLRDSLAGQFIYYASGRKLFRPRVEENDYVVPERYLLSSDMQEINLPPIKTNEDKKSDSEESSKYVDDLVLVDWDSAEDPDNPKNWPFLKKCIVSLILCVLTTSVYMGTAIFTPATEMMREHFNTSQPRIMLGLTLFVYGYGLGPLLFSAMSENPLFGGRTYIFIVSQLAFIILQIPTALCNHIAPFAILRFLAGVVASPPLTNGGAAFGDFFAFPTLVWALIAWSVGAVAGPYIGPLIGAALVESGNWRWSIWYLLIQAGVVLLVMVFLLPETSEQALLMRKARRLRRITGNPKIVARGELDLQSQNWPELIRSILWLPIEISMRESVLMLINLHLALVYSVIYLYFEAFPLVFGGVYHFTLVEQGAAYLSLLIGCLSALVLYTPYLFRNLIAPLEKGEEISPEKVFVRVTIVGSLLVPTGVFIFGWTSTQHIHWIVSLIGVTLFALGTWLLFQTYIAYLGRLYPTRLASALASNTLVRCLVGGCFPLFGTKLYENTGSAKFPVGWGCTILGFIGIAMIGLPIYLLIKGESLRDRALRKYGAKLLR